MASSQAGFSLAAVRAALPRGGALPERAWRARHRGICVLLWVHVAALIVVGTVRGEPVTALLFGPGLVAVLTGLAMWDARSHSFRSTMATLGLLASSAILIDFYHGLIEAHFHFFITIAVVSLYQVWGPYLLAVGFVLVHHAVLGTLAPDMVYNHHMAIENPWLFALVHGSAVLAESAACLVFWRVTEDALDAERAVGDALVESNAELTQANRAVADLVAMLSHDLRVPLSVVIGYSEMALESWPKMTDDEQIEFVRKVSKAGRALHAMLDDTLTVSALDADGVEPRRVPVRVDQAVREAIMNLPDGVPADLDLAGGGNRGRRPWPPGPGPHQSAHQRCQVRRGLVRGEQPRGPRHGHDPDQRLRPRCACGLRPAALRPLHSFRGRSRWEPEGDRPRPLHHAQPADGERRRDPLRAHRGWRLSILRGAATFPGPVRTVVASCGSQPGRHLISDRTHRQREESSRTRGR